MSWVRRKGIVSLIIIEHDSWAIWDFTQPKFYLSKLYWLSLYSENWKTSSIFKGVSPFFPCVKLGLIKYSDQVATRSLYLISPSFHQLSLNLTGKLPKFCAGPPLLFWAAGPINFEKLDRGLGLGKIFEPFTFLHGQWAWRISTWNQYCCCSYMSDL